MPVPWPAEAVETAPLPLQLSPGIIWMVVPAGTPLTCSCGMPAKFWPRLNPHEPGPTCLICTALNVFCTRVGGASRHTSFVCSDGGDVSEADSQPFSALRSAPGSFQPACTCRASKSVPEYQLSVIVGPFRARKERSLTIASVVPSE